MAIPTMQNNTPSAGYISWGAFTIQLNGVNYAVGAGSTNSRWVWWLYNAGAPVITSGADVPTTLTDDDLVLFANKNGIGVRVQSTNFVDGELLVDGSIFADALSTNLINSQHIVTAGLDAGVIKFGEMSGSRISVGTLLGDRIIAKSIYASQLAITDFENYVSDPYFTLGHWPALAGVATVSITDMPLGIGTANVLRFTGGGTRDFRGTQKIDFRPNDVGYISVYVRKTTNTASPVGTVNLRFRYYDAAGANLTPFYLEKTLANSAMVQNTWYEVVIDPAVLPAGRVSATVDLLTVGVNATDTYEFAVPSVYKKENGKLIVDGTIAGKALVADTVTAREVAANAITAESLTIGTLGGELVLNGGFEDVGNWTFGVTATRQAASARSGGWGVRLTASGGVGVTCDQPFPVSPGQSLATTIWAKGVTATVGLYFRISWRNAAGAEIAITDPVQNVAVPVGSVWTEYSQVSAAAPALATTGVLQLYNTTGVVDVDDISVRQQIISSQIKDGAITTPLLFAGAVTAEKVGADVMVTNSLFSREGYFGTIVADQIDSGYITAELGLLGKLAVGEIMIDPAVGIQVPGPDGMTVLSSTGVGHRFAGAIDTDEVTINGGLTVNAQNNLINGQIQLSNVVVPPTQQAGVSRYWPYTTPTGSDVLGLTDSVDGTKWVAIYIGNGRKVRSYNKVTGVLVDNLAEDYWGPDYVAYSISRAGVYFFMVCWKKSTNQWRLCRVSATFGSFIDLTNIGSVSNITACAVGRNEITGFPIIVHKTVSFGTTYTVKEYNLSGVEMSNEAFSVINPDGSNWITQVGDYVYSVTRGLIGPAGEEQVAIVASSSVRFFNVTTKAIQWWPGTAEGPKGVCVEYGTTNKLRYLGYSTYRVYEWVREATWADGSSIAVTYSWFDSKTAGTGKHETTPAPVLNTTVPWKWAALQVDASAPSNTGGDDSPDSVVVYFDNNRQPEVPVGKSSNVFRSKVTGAAAKTVNEFNSAAAYPGSIMAAATMPDGVTPRFLVKGDGQGNWGNLVVDGNGKATIGGDTGWIDVVNFTNLWENYGGAWRTGGYRKIGNMVFLKGLIRTPPGSFPAGTGPFLLPVGFRPPADIMVTAMFERVRKQIDATGDTGKAGFNTSGTNNGSTPAHTHTVSIPNYDITTNVMLQSIGGRLDIQPGGGIYVQNADLVEAGWISLEGISFLVD